MRVAFSLLTFLLSAVAWAQFDAGLSIGGCAAFMGERGDDPHARATFDPDGLQWPMLGLYYRERSVNGVAFGADITYLRREFQASYGYSSQAASVSKDMSVRLDLLYLGILPEVRLGPSGNSVFRFGLQMGILVGSKMSGYATASGIATANPYWDRWYEGSASDDFGGDLRLLVGLGFRIPVGNERSISIDPYASGAFSSMLKEEPGNRSLDLGLRIGLGRLFAGLGTRAL